MKLFRLFIPALISLLLLSSLAFGQQDMGTISGNVTEQGSGEAIRGAMVGAYQVDGHHWPVDMARTDSAGNYELSVPYGDYVVKAHKWNYYPEWWQEASHRDSATAITVDADNNPDAIDFTLEAFTYGGISGVVTDASTGDPIAMAYVLAIQTEFPYHHRWGRTNEAGEYLLEMPSGTYHVQAWAFGYMPGHTDDPIVVVDEIVTGVNFALNPLVFGSISGTVYSSDSLPIAHAIVEARKEGGCYRMMDRTDQDGNYTINYLIPGSYIMRAFAYNYDPQTLEDPVVVNGDDVTGIDFYLNPYESPYDGYISGYVTDENTSAPIENALVTAVILGHWDRRMIRRTHSDENGYYIFDELPDRNCKIICMAADYIPEFYDDKSSWHDADPVTPDADSINFALAPVDVSMRMISGIVRENGLAVDGAVVMASLDGEIVNATVTYPDGWYYLENLEPGDYSLEILSPSQAEGSIDVSVVLEDVYDADVILSPTSSDDNFVLPQATSLLQNYPNPFNATTNISFTMDTAGDVELSIYDILGRKITTLVTGKLAAGSHTFSWGGLDDNGNQVSSGMYLYVLKTADETLSNRMLLLK